MSAEDADFENINIIQLTKRMLSPKTLPHLVVAGLISVLLFYLVRVNDVLTSVAFLSLSLSYLIISALASNSAVSKLTTYHPTDNDISIMKRLFSSFKITVVPLLLASALIGLVYYSIGGKGNNWVVPVLGSLFILWSVAQALSFRVGMVEWLGNGLGDAKLHTYREKISTTSQIVIVQSFAFLIVWIGQTLNSAEKISLGEAFLGGFLFICLTTLVQVVTLWITKQEREAAGNEKGIAAFSFKWMIISQIFITWHLFSVYRRNFMETSSISTIFEESILMALTVLFAVWSLTTYTVNDGKRIVSEEASLPLAISFAYAYAGSVSVLSVAFDGVEGVMTVGHLLSVITMILLLKPTLRNSRISSKIELSSIDNENQLVEDTSKGSETEEKNSKNEDSDEWQKDDGIDWEEGKNIAKDTDWKNNDDEISKSSET